MSTNPMNSNFCTGTGSWHSIYGSMHGASRICSAVPGPRFPSHRRVGCLCPSPFRSGLITMTSTSTLETLETFPLFSLFSCSIIFLLFFIYTPIELSRLLFSLSYLSHFHFPCRLASQPWHISSTYRFGALSFIWPDYACPFFVVFLRFGLGLNLDQLLFIISFVLFPFVETGNVRLFILFVLEGKCADA